MSILGCWLKIFFFYLPNALLKYKLLPELFFLASRDLFFLECHILLYLSLPSLYEERNYLSLFLKAYSWISITRVKKNQNWCTSSQHNLRHFSVEFHDTIDSIADQRQTLLTVSYRINSCLFLAQSDPNSFDFYKSVLGFLIYKVYYY